MMQGKDWITLVSRFKSQTLSKKEWTHESHLIVALWYLLEYKNIHTTLCYLRADIILHNYSVGIKNTESHGYHETITIFWLKQLEEFIERFDTRDFSVLVEKLLRHDSYIKRDYILQFYRQETLKTSKARCFYVTPF